MSGARQGAGAPYTDSATLSYSASRFLNRSANATQLASPLPVAQIAQIQVPHGSHAAPGAKIGGAFGLGLAVFAVAVTAGDSWVSPTPEQAGEAIVGLTAVGLA